MKTFQVATMGIYDTNSLVSHSNNCPTSDHHQRLIRDCLLSLPLFRGLECAPTLASEP